MAKLSHALLLGAVIALAIIGGAPVEPICAAENKLDAAIAASKVDVQGLGVDTISADYGLSRTFEVHKAVLGQGLYLIENLANLELVPARGATLICAPLPIKDGTGSPARIMAIVPNKQN